MFILYIPRNVKTRKLKKKNYTHSILLLGGWEKEALVNLSLFRPASDTFPKS